MSLDFLRGPDDEIVEQIQHRALMQEIHDRPRHSIGDCPVCHTPETLMIGDVCHQCEYNQRDSRAARALCDLIHRRKAAE